MRRLPGEPELRNGFDRIVATEQARGIKTLLVVAGSRGRPPSSPTAYARYVGNLARRYRGRVEAYEIWNEQDERRWWRGAPQPARYVRLLKAAYRAIKRNDRSARVVFGPTTGNNYDFLARAYKAGAKGSFDAVGVHTDTGCLTRGPSEFYRERNGRLGRFTFLGFREMRATMRRYKDPKPIWMTEFGWSAATHTCDRGSNAGRKPAGVGAERQAQYLREAVHCMAGYPYLQVALWFTNRDAAGNGHEINSYGLKRFDGSLRPAFAAFTDVALNGDRLTTPCGDFAPPRMRILSPRRGTRIGPRESVPIRATSSDGDVAYVKFTHGRRTIRVFSGRGRPMDFARFTPAWRWQRVKKLPYGRHRIVVRAYDFSGNEGRASVVVHKVRAHRLPRARTRFTALRLTGSGRSRRLTGRLVSSRRFRIPGKVYVKWQARRKGGGWHTVHRFARLASRPFAFGERLRHGGRWRVRVEYPGVPPHRRAVSRWIEFRA
jgi:hypothetical protein